MLQGHNFLQAAKAVLRILRKAWGPWALEARPAKGWGSGEAADASAPNFSGHS